MVAQGIALARVERGRWFFVGTSLLVIALVAAGFTRSALVPLAQGRFEPPLVIGVHAALSCAWLVLLLVQTSLVAGGRTAWHRRLGWTAAVLAPTMVVFGLAAGVHAFLRDVQGADPHAARAFLVTPLFDMLLFAGLVGTALVNRRRPDVHKRLLLIAAITLAGAGLFRLVLPVFGAAAGIWTVVFGDGLILLLWLHDWRTLGRVHHVSLIAGVITVLVHIGELTLGETDLWQRWSSAFAAWMIG